jgi:hypothetical protein
MPLASQVFGHGHGLGRPQMTILAIIGTIVIMFAVLFSVMAWFGL